MDRKEAEKGRGEKRQRERKGDRRRDESKGMIENTQSIPRRSSPSSSSFWVATDSGLE
jgi:hypothetical protein